VLWTFPSADMKITCLIVHIKHAYSWKQNSLQQMKMYIKETLMTLAQGNKTIWYRWLKLYICIGGRLWKPMQRNIRKAQINMFSLTNEKNTKSDERNFSYFSDAWMKLHRNFAIKLRTMPKTFLTTYIVQNLFLQASVALKFSPAFFS